MSKIPADNTTNVNKYWHTLLTDFNLSSKLWLEGFDTVFGSGSEKTVQTAYLIQRLPLPEQLSHIISPHFIHAAWAILLNRFTGSDDICYGAALLDHIESDQKILLQQMPLPVRSTIHEQETIATYLHHFQNQLDENTKHANEFFTDQLAQEQINNLIHYLFIYSDSKSKSTFNSHNIEIKPEQYPLLLIYQDKNPLNVEFYYNPAQYTTNSIDKISKHFIIILEKLAKEPNQEVTHFSALLTDEKIKLDQFEHTYTDQYQEKQALCCHQLFQEQVKKFPAKLAVTDASFQLSYQELDQLANQLAHLLLEKNVQIGEPVAVLMERTPAIIVAMLAIFKIGAMYIPISPKYPDERIQYVLSDANPNVILANDKSRIPTDYQNKTQILNDSYQHLASYSKESPNRQFSAKEIAYIIYTSGTTGQPKGVMIKHESLTNLALWYQQCFALSEKDRCSQFASSGFDTFLCEAVPPLTVGASIHIIDDNTKLTPTLFLPWVAAQGITICDLPTSYAQILFNMPWPTCNDLRLVKIGGESLTHYPTQPFSFDIWNIYGPTEATIECTFIKIYEANAPVESYQHKHVPPPIGKPIANAEMYIVDQHFELVAIGNVGELLIGGRIVSTGYLNRQQLTREKFIRNLYSSDPEAKLYRTGDLVRWLDDGNLEFIGRVDNQVKIRGYRIELNEIESVIAQYPDMSEVVVLAKEIVNGQKTLIAYLVPNLDKLRIPYHEKCLLNIDDIQFIEAQSDDISKEGIAITGLSEPLNLGTELRINIKLPGTSDGQWLSGKVIWQIEQRAGIAFDKSPHQMDAMNKSIEFYLATHNLMETIQNAASRRNIKKAIKSKLPDYMIPSVFSILPQFPHTFNGKIDWKALPPPKDFERLLERKFVAPRTDTEKDILKIWCDILNIKQASMTDNFFDLGGNSLMLSQLSVQIMKKFNLSIPVRVFIDLPFIPVLAEYIESKGQKYTFKSTIQDEIQHDAILNDDIFVTKKLGDLKNPKEILLTGVSGFLGIYLLRELLKLTDAKIYCLVRKGQFESCAKRLSDTIQQYQLDNEIQLSNRRIIILDSDIGNDRFGLSTRQYDTLAEKIDIIYHCGAQVNTMASYTNLRNSNVQGTIEVIKFATKAKDKPIHYISTLSAAVKLDGNGHYAEEFPEEPTHNLVGGYGISKWVSERLLTQIKKRGLPVNIYRSGHIFGQADNGVTSVNNSLLYFIKGCLQLGLAPNWEENMTFLPVDFASKAVINISLHHPENSAVYHLDHPQGIMWIDLVAWLQQYGYSIKLCSHQEWRDCLTSVKPENALYPFLPQYLADETPPKTPATSMEHAQSTLHELGMDIPPINDSLLKLYFDHLCEIDFLPTPEAQKESLSSPTPVS